MALNGLWKMLYWRYLRNVPYANIPISLFFGQIYIANSETSAVRNISDELSEIESVPSQTYICTEPLPSKLTDALLNNTKNVQQSEIGNNQ